MRLTEAFVKWRCGTVRGARVPNAGGDCAKCRSGRWVACVVPHGRRRCETPTRNADPKRRSGRMGESGLTADRAANAPTAEGSAQGERVRGCEECCGPRRTFAEMTAQENRRSYRRDAIGGLSGVSLSLGSRDEVSAGKTTDCVVGVALEPRRGNQAKCMHKARSQPWSSQPPSQQSLGCEASE